VKSIRWVLNPITHKCKISRSDERRIGKIKEQVLNVCKSIGFWKPYRFLIITIPTRFQKPKERHKQQKEKLTVFPATVVCLWKLL
jgi:hypothetical protein